MIIQLKRAYDPPAKRDGRRILVDHIWPRGLSRERLRLDRWIKELAPGTALRKWFGNEPAKWQEFKQRYFAELRRRSAALADLRNEARAGRITLIFAAADVRHNNAVALREYFLAHVA